MSISSTDPEETQLAPDELAVAGLSSNPIPPVDSVALGELAPTAVEAPATAGRLQSNAPAAAMATAAPRRARRGSPERWAGVTLLMDLVHSLGGQHKEDPFGPQEPMCCGEAGFGKRHVFQHVSHADDAESFRVLEVGYVRTMRLHVKVPHCLCARWP